MIRRRRLRQCREGAPPTLKQREGGDGAVGNSTPVGICDLRISVAELNFDDLGAFWSVGASRRFGEEGDAEGVTAGPGNGDAGNWTVETVVERVNHERVSGLAGELDQSPIADGVGGHFLMGNCVLGFYRFQGKKHDYTSVLNLDNPNLFTRELVSFSNNEASFFMYADADNNLLHLFIII